MLGPASKTLEATNLCLTFEELLRQLTFVHAHQQRLIQLLTDENASLRQCSDDINTDTDSPDNVLSSSKVATTANMPPPAPFDETAVATLPSDSLALLHHDIIAECPPSPTTTCDRGLCTFTSAEVVGEERIFGKISDMVSRPRLQRANSSGGHSMGESSDVHTVDTGVSQCEWPVPESWPEWMPVENEVLRRVTRSSLSHLCVIEDTTGQAMTVVNRFHQKLMMRPNSATRLCWDFVSGIMVCYDVITIPLMCITLDIDQFLTGGGGPFTEVMDWVTTVFWTLDVPWSFMTGYHTEGLVEMRASHIARHYLKTWFAFDLLIIVVDWLVMAVGVTLLGGSGLFRLGKTARVSRILRAVRLLRFVKLQRALSEALELMASETMRTTFNIWLAVMFIFGINHYLACGWYLIGHIGRMKGNPNWIEANRIQDGSVAYAYFSSLHWSLTQFTPASMEIRPYNLAERVYSIACLLFALITFSSFLGSITASITQLRKQTTEAGRQQFILRAYFTKNKVSSQLSRSIWTFLVRNHFSHQTRSHKAKIEILKLLPPTLAGRLHQELYGPYITRAPFFYHYTVFCNDGLMELCVKAITERTVIRNEVLFMEGLVAEKMFFIASGYLRYDPAQPRRMRVLGTGSWIGEPVLWVKWVHVAPLLAETYAEIIALDAAKFRTTVALFKQSFSFVKVYAQQFRQYLLELGPTNQSDLLTDLGTLESMTRAAWYQVSSEKDWEFYTEMPHKEFPQLRKSRIRSFIWADTPDQKPLLQRLVAWAWRRRTRNAGVVTQGIMDV